MYDLAFNLLGKEIFSVPLLYQFTGHKMNEFMLLEEKVKKVIILENSYKGEEKILVWINRKNNLVNDYKLERIA